MKASRFVPSAIMIAALSGCANQVDVAAEQASLMETDRAWAETASGEDLGQMVSFLAEDGAVFAPGLPVLRGREAVQGFLSEASKAPGFSVGWEPTEVSVGEGGTLGYTSGVLVFTSADSAGNVMTEQSRYVTIWRKHEGDWKAVIDMWNAEPPEES